MLARDMDTQDMTKQRIAITLSGVGSFRSFLGEEEALRYPRLGRTLSSLNQMRDAVGACKVIFFLQAGVAVPRVLST